MDLGAAARRNLFLLAGGMAALYGMVELSFGASTLTFEEAGGTDALSGVAPAIFLVCAGLAAFPAGRAMDRSGRRRVLAAGFAIGAAGSLIAAAGVASESLALALAGFGLTGAATGTILLSRAAAADMFPPERQPRAIALVLFGAVFGALLGPLVFTPLLEAGEGGSSLDLAWLGAAGFMLAGLAVVMRLRPDPQEIARALASGPGPDADPAPAEPLRRIVARPGVIPALVAALACWTAMLAIMTLTGKALVDHGHGEHAIFPVIALHFVGMFGLFIVVGRAIERFGRIRALTGGLLLLAASCVSLIGAIESVPLTALALFGVGLGWNLAFVAASAELSERAAPSERGTLLGFSDLTADLTGAAFAIGGGIALDADGLTFVCLAAAVMPVVAAVWIARRPTGPPVPLPASAQPPGSV